MVFLHLFWIINVFECMTKSVSLLQRSSPFPSYSWASISRSSQTPEINTRILKVYKAQEPLLKTQRSPT